MKRNRLTIAVAAVLILIFGSLLFVFQVRQSEVAVVTTFGNPTGDPISQPGAYFRWPWPIQNVYKLDQRIQSFEGIFEEAKLKDQNAFMMSVYVGWRIQDPKVFFPKFENGNVDKAEDALSSLVESTKMEVAGQHPISDFVSAEESKTKFAQIEDELLQKVQQKVKDRNYGLEVKFVQIKKLGLPESVTQNVFERMQSERQVLITAIQAEGEEEVTKIKSTADHQAAMILAEADAKALQIRGEGEAEASKSLSVLQQNPELATFNLKLNALEQMLKEKTTLILDQGTPPLDLLLNKPGVSKAGAQDKK